MYSYNDNYPDGLSIYDLRHIEGYEYNEEERQRYEDEYWDREIDKALGK